MKFGMAVLTPFLAAWQKISQILHQIARLKEAITGRRKVPIIRSSSTFNSFPDH